MVGHGQPQPPRGSEIGLLPTGPGGGPRHAWRAQGGAGRCRQTVWQDGDTHLYYSVCGKVLWGSWAKARLVNSNKKSGVLVSFTGVLSKGCMRGRLWEAGETVYHKGCWGTHPYLRLCSCHLGQCHSRLLQAAYPRQQH